jgi:dihydrofolate reductase
VTPSSSRRLSAFIQVSLDGYFCTVDGDMSFAHKEADDLEWQEFVDDNASGGGMLVFGRTTYDMMAGWWPTPAAAAAMPEVAKQMNGLPKLVFSRTLESADWSNTTLIREDAARAMRGIKSEPGPDMTILGSGSLVTRLAAAGLLDTLQVVVNPVALGAGRAIFDGLGAPLQLGFAGSRVFANGSVVLRYEPRP